MLAHEVGRSASSNHIPKAATNEADISAKQGSLISVLAMRAYEPRLSRLGVVDLQLAPFVSEIASTCLMASIFWRLLWVSILFFFSYEPVF